MESEMQALYRVLNEYRTSLVGIFAKLDFTISGVLTNDSAPTSSMSLSKRHKISLELTRVLQHYIEMIYSSENLLLSVIKNLAEVDCDTHPERDSYINSTINSNDSFAFPNSNDYNDLVLELTSDFNENREMQMTSEIFNSPVLSNNVYSSVVLPMENLSVSPALVPDSPPPVPPRKKVTFCEPIGSSNSDKETSTLEFDWTEGSKMLEARHSKQYFIRKNLELSGKSKDRGLTFIIPDDTLRVNQICLFCHVVSPSEFYVRTNQAMFKQLETDINDELNEKNLYVINKYKSKQQAQTHLGEYCFGFIPEKSKWFRLQILDWMDPSDETIYVLLIDYGEKLYCKYTNLKEMTVFYAQFPKMAIRCHFAGIYSSKWSRSCCDFLKEFSGMKNLTEFQTIYVHKDSQSYAVDLQKQNDQDTVGQILVSHGFALQMKLDDDSDVDDEDDFNFENETLSEAITGYDAKDEARICPFTDSFGRCFKGPSCKLDHGKLAADGLTTDKMIVANQALVSMELPQIGDLVDILVTGYVNTCHFYAHYLHNKKDMFNESFEALLQTMSAKKVVAEYEQLKISPGLGELLLVNYNGNWLRGKCVDYLPNNGFEIFLVDFGNKLIKSLSDLRIIKSEFLEIPFQAIDCVLYDCQEKKDIPKLTSMNFFENSMKMKSFKAQVMEYGKPMRLKIWDGNIEMKYILQQFGLVKDINRITPKNSHILACE